MSDYGREHTYQELLDRLLRLEEDMEDVKETFLNVRASLDDIRRAIKIDRSNTIQRLDDVGDYLYPAFYKVFPNIARDHQSITSFLKNFKRPRPQKPSETDGE